MVPKCKSSDTGNLDTPKRSWKVLPLSEESSRLSKQRKKLYAEVAKIYGKNKSYICKIVKEKEICAGFAVTPQTVIVMATVSEFLVKMDKVWNLRMEDMNRKRVPSHGNVTPESAEPVRRLHHGIPWNEWHRAMNRSGLKKTKVTGEATPADEEAAATFSAEVKK